MLDANLSGKLAIDASNLNSLKEAAKDNSPESIKAAAKQFEAVFVNMMLKSMRDATPQDGAMDSDQTRTYTSMLDQQLSQNIASRGLGLADIMARQLSRASGIAGANGNASAADPLSAAATPGSQAWPATGIGNPWSAHGASAAEASSKPAGVSRLSGAAQSFQQKVADHAEEASRATGIPASFMIGQAALESGWGKREIKGADGSQSYNLFGIKATPSWKGKVVEAVTTEYVHGVPQKRVEKFRAYDSYADSFKDFAGMMQKSPRYENVMASLDNVQEYAHAIQKAGYATDPQYASKLISIVKKVEIS